MPFTILVPVILIGLLLIIGTVYFSSPSKVSEELTENLAEELFKKGYPAVFFEKIIIDDRQNIALIFGQNNIIGLVARFGQNYVTRELNFGFIKRIEETRRGINIWLNDFTLKRVNIIIDDMERKNYIAQQLKSTRENNGYNNS